MIESDYNQQSNEIQKHKSVNNKDDDDITRSISLDDCILNYHKIEKLQDKVHCDQCEESTPHTKYFQIFRPPPVLIIQLKRFKQVEG